MLYLGPVKEKSEIKRLFEERNFVFSDKSGCLTAKSGDEVIGLSLYELDSESMTVLHIEPVTDVALADGILRSTLHIACENGVMTAYYADTLPLDFLKKINFIKSESEKTLLVDKLFKSCCGCE